MNEYDAKSCSTLEKPYYKPIEAALRWCNLIQHEVVILQTTGDDLLPKISAFPQWACLRKNAEKIYDAILNGELAHGRDGRTVSKGEHVKNERLTIRHTDLKVWMSKHYPDQKPAFLFDDLERTTHSSINADSFRALQVDRDAARAELVMASKWAGETQKKLSELQGERDSLAAMVEKNNAPGPRAETSYLNIIGGLLGLMLGKSPSGKPQSIFENQSEVIEEMLIQYGDLGGVSKTTLESKFAQANRSIKDT
jgi:hypothetical protein